MGGRGKEGLSAYRQEDNQDRPRSTPHDKRSQQERRDERFDVYAHLAQSGDIFSEGGAHRPVDRTGEKLPEYSGAALAGKEPEEQNKQSEQSMSALSDGELRKNYSRLLAKYDTALEENHGLWSENDRLREELKELRELKEKDERRKEKQRKRSEKWRKEHPELHRARAHKSSRNRRSDNDELAESA